MFFWDSNLSFNNSFCIILRIKEDLFQKVGLINLMVILGHLSWKSMMGIILIKKSLRYNLALMQLQKCQSFNPMGNFQFCLLILKLFRSFTTIKDITLNVQYGENNNLKFKKCKIFPIIIIKLISSRYDRRTFNIFHS